MTFSQQVPRPSVCMLWSDTPYCWKSARKEAVTSRNSQDTPCSCAAVHAAGSLSSMGCARFCAKYPAVLAALQRSLLELVCKYQKQVLGYVVEGIALVPLSPLAIGLPLQGISTLHATLTVPPRQLLWFRCQGTACGVCTL